MLDTILLKTNKETNKQTLEGIKRDLHQILLAVDTVCYGILQAYIVETDSDLSDQGTLSSWVMVGIGGV